MLDISNVGRDDKKRWLRDVIKTGIAKENRAPQNGSYVLPP